MSKGEITRRHDTVADAIARVAWQVGAQVRREVEGLNPDNRQRPDVQIAFPGRLILTDVVVTHTTDCQQHRLPRVCGRRRKKASRTGNTRAWLLIWARS